MTALSRFLTTWIAFTSVGYVASLSYPDCDKPPMSRNDVCKVGLDPAKRAAALVAAMNITEKLVNLVDHSLGAARIGLPEYEWWNEALHGVAGSPGVHFAQSGNFSSATSFPSPITMSAAFDDALIESVGIIIGSEARAYANAGRAGVDFWTPNINPYKDPRWGRGQETPGEDPLRISKYVKGLLKGMEWAGKGPDTLTARQIIATCKHYAAYDLERWNGTTRYMFDAIVSMQDLVEYYLPPFKQCARDSNVGSIMCSYNAINGTPACANEYLLQTVLREHWNWTQHNNYIVSDCNAVHNIYQDHKFVENAAQAAGVAFNAGTDNVCEAGGWTTDVIGAYNQSLISKATIDKMLRRQYEGLVRADFWKPLDDDVTGFRSYGPEYVNTDAADRLARQAAADGMVLLKNDGILPLKLKKNQTVALIGMWANDTFATRRMLGNYHGISPVYRTPLYAAQQLGLNAKYYDWPVSSNNNNTNFTGLMEIVRASDVVLYFGGIDTSIENEDLDRMDVAWPSIQLDLISKVTTLQKPLVVVQLGTQVDNTPLLGNSSDANVNAILWAGYPGMEGGPAVFDILTGKKAPAGRLPITQYPKEYTELSQMTDMSLRPSNGNPGRTYKWYNTSVQPFGFGLHYTNFTVEFGPPYNVQHEEGKRNPPVFQSNEILADCEETHKDLCPFPSLPIVVTNTGSTTSDFVALAFVSTKQGPPPYPIKELVSYKRVRDIKPKEARSEQLDFTVGDFARVDESGNTVLYDGAYCLGLDVPEQSNFCFEILGGDAVLDKWPQPKSNSTVRVSSKMRGH